MVWKSQSEVLKRCRMPFPSSLNLSHVTPRIGTPDSWNQDYVKDAPNCGYTCKPGWIGDDCNTREELPTCGNTPNTCAFT